MACVAHPVAKLPKINLQPAAYCNADFAAAAARLNAKSRRFFLKNGRGWYNIFAVSLSSGRFATLTQWETFPRTIEIDLELVRELFYEDDLLEILEVCGLKMEDASRQGAFKWK